MPKHIRVFLGGLIALLAISSSATAATIIGGSNLLSQADADQLQTWLGEGNIALTNIFSHVPGDGKTSLDFHAAADGQGRTFSIIEVLAGTSHEHGLNNSEHGDLLIGRQVIGGYNPQSWNSTYSYNMTPTNADRTAFLFNLTSGLLQAQNLIGQGLYDGGVYQTYNSSFYGPTFGGGHDIYIELGLVDGYAANYSYGGTTYTQNIINSPTVANNSYNSFSVGRIEVFTISAAAADEVPEPASLALWSLASLAGFAAWRRRKQSVVAAAN